MQAVTGKSVAKTFGELGSSAKVLGSTVGFSSCAMGITVKALNPVNHADAIKHIGSVKSAIDAGAVVFDIGGLFASVSQLADSKYREKLKSSKLELGKFATSVSGLAMKVFSSIDKLTTKLLSQKDIKVGNSGVYKIVTSALFALSATFDLIINAKKLGKHAADVEKRELKLHKWTNMTQVDQRQHYDEKSGRVVKNRDSELNRIAQKRFGSTFESLDVDARAIVINKAYSCAVRATDGNLKQWKLLSNEVKLFNARRSRTKTIVSIAAAATKIAAIIIGTVVGALTGTFAFLSLAEIPFVVDAVSQTSKGTGLFKYIFDTLIPEKQVPGYVPTAATAA